MSIGPLWEIAGPQPRTQRFNPRLLAGRDCVEPVFRIGSSDPKTEWPRMHPGPLNETTGNRELSATIVFDLDPDDATNGRWHVLELSGMDGSGPCPDLRIDVNGHAALIVPDSVRADRRHAPGPPSPIGGVIERELWIPPGRLVDGENRIVVTTIAALPFSAEGIGRSQRPDLGSHFGSTLRWIRLALRAEDAGGRPPTPTATVALTPLFRRTDAGRLEETVEVLVRDVHDHAGASVSVDVAGHVEAVKPGDGPYEFGDVRMRFAIPDPVDGSPADQDPAAVEAVVDVETGEGSTRSTSSCRPARKWTVHVMPHVHLDIGYTDAQAKVIELHSNNLDKALGILDHDPGWSFSIDGSFVIEQFMRSRDPEQVEALMQRLRSGQLSLNAMWALLLSGVSSLEDLYRSMYFAARLAREHDVPVTYANFTDVPSYSAAIPSILAASGVESFMGIANHTRGGNADSDTLHLQSPVVWQGPDGAEVLAFFVDCYSQLRFVCADPVTVPGAAQGLTKLLARYDRPDYLPTDLPLVGSHADNEDLSHGHAGFVDRWNAEYEWPRLRFSTMADYLAAVRPLQDDLPRLTGDGGSYWEDGVGTQGEATAMARGTQTLLPAVEAASALITRDTARLHPDIETLDEAWRASMIGSEHTWTSAHATAHPHAFQSHDQLDWKVTRIRLGHRIATDESRRALSQLSERLQLPSVPCLVVVNPTGHSRRPVIDVELPDDAVVLDGSGHELPTEPGRWVEERDRAMPVEISPLSGGLRRMRIRLPELEPFGYAALGLGTVEAPPSAQPDEPAPATLSTGRYQVFVDPENGSVTGLRHVDADGNERELLDQDRDWALGDVLYATGGGTAHGRGLDDEISSIFDYDPALPPAQISVERVPMGPARLRRTPWGHVLERDGHGPTMPSISERVEFFDDSDDVEVVVEIVKEPTLAKESVYVAFPFLAADPVIGYDRHQGWVDPAEGHHVGACNEWLTVQNAVSVQDRGSDRGVIWTSADAPLFTSSDVVRGTWPTSFVPTNGTVLSWVMNNYWMTNTPAEQSGRVRLRYRFRPVDHVTPQAAGELGRDLRNPVLVSDVLNTDRADDEPRPLPATGTLYGVDVPDHVAVSVFAGRGRGSITLRLQEFGGRPASIRLPHPLNAPERWATTMTATETELEALDVATDGTVGVDLAAYQVVTIGFGA